LLTEELNQEPSIQKSERRRPWKSAAASDDHFNLDTTPLQVGGIKEVLLSNLESAERGVK